MRAGYTDTADMVTTTSFARWPMPSMPTVIYLRSMRSHAREPMEVTEGLVAATGGPHAHNPMLVESNNGGRGFARALQRLLPRVRIEWFHQSGNKEARILSRSATVMHSVRFPRGVGATVARDVCLSRPIRAFSARTAGTTRLDVLTGIVEREAPGVARILKIRSVGFFLGAAPKTTDRMPLGVCGLSLRAVACSIAARPPCGRTPA